MSFIDEIRETTATVATPKGKAFEALKEKIKSTASYGYNSTTLSPSDFLDAWNIGNNYKDISAREYIYLVEHLVSALKREGFIVSPGQYEDGSGYFHRVKW